MSKPIPILFHAALFALLLLLVPPAHSSSVYKEFSVTMQNSGSDSTWRVTDPSSSNAGAQEFLPNPNMTLTVDDLSNAASASAMIDQWGGHPGTHPKQFRLNGNAWISVPELAETVPSGHDGSCYYYQRNIEVEVPLPDLLQGNNVLTGTSGPNDLCGDTFDWGQWGWYIFTLKVRYSDSKPHATAQIIAPAQNGIITENPTVKILATAPDGLSVERVEAVAYYEGMDEDGDGLYTDYHESYRHLKNSPAILHEHMAGSSQSGTAGIYSIRWNTSLVPDQSPGSIRLKARVLASNGVWYESDELSGLSLLRPASSVKLSKAEGVPQKFGVRNGQNKSSSFTINTLDGATGAKLVFLTWNGNNAGENPYYIKVNDYTLMAGYGQNHYYDLDIVDVPLSQLHVGANSFSMHSQTIHHGIEMLWPGPHLLVTYESAQNTSDTTPPAVSATHSPSLPSPQDTVTFTAFATDASGISDLKIFLDGNELPSSCNNALNSRTCVSSAGPFAAGANISYHATAADNSEAHNAAQSPPTGEFSFIVSSPSTPAIQITSPSNGQVLSRHNGSGGIPIPQNIADLYSFSILDNSSHGRTKIADMNNDGQNDILAHQWATPLSGSTYTYNFDGQLFYYQAPTWEKKYIETSQRFGSDSVLPVDIDGDLDLDVLATVSWRKSSTDNGSLVYLYDNLDAANNQWGEILLANLTGISDVDIKELEVADFDSDGKMDVAARLQTVEAVLFQDSKTSWAKKTTAIVRREGSAVGDVDHDGKADIILNGYWLKNPGGRADSWARYDIDPIWYSHGPIPGEEEWRNFAAQIRFADMDADGRKDIIFAQAELPTFNITWYSSSNPTGGPSAWAAHKVALCNRCHSFEVADFDSDGDIDALGGTIYPNAGNVNGTGGELFIAKNLGGATNWQKQVIDNYFVYQASVGDIGNDGDLDIASSRTWRFSPMQVWQTNLSLYTSGQPGLDNWEYKLVDGSRPKYNSSFFRFFGIASSDATGDGFSDIVSGRYFYRNPGGNIASSWPRVTLPTEADGALFANIDGDSSADIIAFHFPTAYWFESTSANGSAWAIRRTLDLGSAVVTDHRNPQASRVADLNADGSPEIIFEGGKPSDGTGGIYALSVPSNPLNGTWPLTRLTSIGGDGFGLGDLNNDGKADIATGNSTIHHFQNTGSLGSWPGTQIGTVEAVGDRFEIADMDSDGKKDIVVSEEYASASNLTTRAYWFKNPGDAGSWQRREFAEGTALMSMAVTDMDSDGDNDVVLGEHRGSKRMFVYGNSGTGTFTQHLVGTGKESHGLMVSDLNNDGANEILHIAWDNYTDLHLWINRNQAAGPAQDEVEITADASAASGIASVKFFAGSVLLSQDASPPYSATWDYTSAANGSHTLMAEALSNDGLFAQHTIQVSIGQPDPGPDRTRPNASMTSPAHGATISGTVALSATATDNVGVSGVQFKLDGGNIGEEDTSLPYGMQWDSTVTNNGPHILSATARDFAGNTRTAFVIAIANNPSPGKQPAYNLQLTSPPEAASIAGAAPAFAWKMPGSSLPITCTLIINGKLDRELSGNSDFSASALFALPAGGHSWSVICADENGNAFISPTQSFTYTPPAPPPPPSGGSGGSSGGGGSGGGSSGGGGGSFSPQSPQDIVPATISQELIDSAAAIPSPSAIPEPAAPLPRVAQPPPTDLLPAPQEDEPAAPLAASLYGLGDALAILVPLAMGAVVATMLFGSLAYVSHRRKSRIRSAALHESKHAARKIH